MSLNYSFIDWEHDITEEFPQLKERIKEPDHIVNHKKICICNKGYTILNDNLICLTCNDILININDIKSNDIYSDHEKTCKSQGYSMTNDGNRTIRCETCKKYLKLNGQYIGFKY